MWGCEPLTCAEVWFRDVVRDGWSAGLRAKRWAAAGSEREGRKDKEKCCPTMRYDRNLVLARATCAL